MALSGALTLFIATFANVFLLSYQSKNIQHNRYLMAGITSVFITLANYVFVKLATEEGGIWFLVYSGLGGSLGVVSAIWVHNRFTKKEAK